MTTIGRLNENLLHAAVGGYVIDVVRADGEVVEGHRFDTPDQLATLLPSNLPDPFTTTELAVTSGLPRRLAGQMAHCLREMGQIRVVGKQGNAWLYERDHHGSP